MSKANYFYIISYPEYSGFRIEHDPVFTAYFAPSEVPASNRSGTGALLVVIVVIVVVALVAAVFVLKRRPKQQART